MMRWLVLGVRAGMVMLSVALAAGWAALLVRGQRCSDVLAFSSPCGESLVVSCRGGAFVLTQPYASPTEWEWHEARLGEPAMPLTAGLGEPVGLGVRYGTYFTSMSHSAWAVAVPYGLLIGVSLLPGMAALLAPAVWRRRPRLRRRLRRGFAVRVARPSGPGAVDSACKPG